MKYGCRSGAIQITLCKASGTDPMQKWALTTSRMEVEWEIGVVRGSSPYELEVAGTYLESFNFRRMASSLTLQLHIGLAASSCSSLRTASESHKIFQERLPYFAITDHTYCYNVTLKATHPQCYER